MLVVKKCCVCYLRTLTVVDTEAFGVRVNSGMKFQTRRLYIYSNSIFASHKVGHGKVLKRGHVLLSL